MLLCNTTLLVLWKFCSYQTAIASQAGEERTQCYSSNSGAACGTWEASVTPSRGFSMIIKETNYIGPDQWRLRHSGLARVFNYDLHCRTWACFLCLFVPSPTSL